MSTPTPKDDAGHEFKDAKEELLSMHSMSDDGTMISNIENMGREWRGVLIGMLYTRLPDFNEFIEKLQLSTDLEAKRNVFMAASRIALEHCYDHPLCEQWRFIASRMVKALDEDAFAQYGVVKYAGTQNPDREQRLKAYHIIIDRFIQLSYTVKGL